MVKRTSVIVSSACFMVGLLGQVASADYTPGSDFGYSNKTTYQDSDWNVSFYDNCALPEYSSTEWVEEDGERFLRFTLKNGQVGGCSNDNRERNRGPWWERAEVKQTNGLERDRNYTLTFRVRFVEGFDTDRESFLQLHQSVRGCRVGPLIIVKFNNGFLEGSFPLVRIADYRGRWLDARFDFKPSSHFDFYLDGEMVIQGQGTRREAQAACLPHLKIGVYRPGDKKATGERKSVLDIDKLWLVDR